MTYRFSNVVLDDGRMYDQLIIELTRLYMTPEFVYEKTISFVSKKGIEVADFVFNVGKCRYEIHIRRDPNVIDEAGVKAVLGDKILYCSLNDNIS